MLLKLIAADKGLLHAGYRVHITCRPSRWNQISSKSASKGQGHAHDQYALRPQTTVRKVMNRILMSRYSDQFST